MIARDLAKRMGLVSRFRNLVVHGYHKIDFSKLYYDYKEDLKDLRVFANQIYEFLQKQNDDRDASIRQRRSRRDEDEHRS